VPSSQKKLVEGCFTNWSLGGKTMKKHFELLGLLYIIFSALNIVDQSNKG